MWLQSLSKKTNSPDLVEELNVPSHWHLIKSMEDIEAIKKHADTLAIFKHSTRCSISKHVLKTFVTDYNAAKSSFNLYYLDLLAFRDLSNHIADVFGVVHQSPQLIIVKNAVAVYDCSHENISFEVLNRFS